MAWDAARSAAVSAATTVTTGLVLPLGGVLADRDDRFRILIGAHALDCTTSAALATLALAGHLSLPIVCAGALAHGLVHGLVHGFSTPASYGLLPRFVAGDRPGAAIGVSAAHAPSAVFAGPAIAGWALVHLGAGLAFATDVLGNPVFFAAAAVLQTPAADVRRRSARASRSSPSLEGVSCIAGHRGAPALLILLLAGDAVSASVNAIMPAYTDGVLDLGVGAMAPMPSAAGLGATVAALWLAHGGFGSATPSRVLWAVLGFAAAICVLAETTILAVAMFGMAMFGFFGETGRTGTVPLVQSRVDDARRGRAMSTPFLFTRIAGAVGTLFVGHGAAWIGLRLPLAISAAASTVVWLGMDRRRHLIAQAPAVLPSMWVPGSIILGSRRIARPARGAAWTDSAPRCRVVWEVGWRMSCVWAEPLPDGSTPSLRRRARRRGPRGRPAPGRCRLGRRWPDARERSLQHLSIR